MHRCFYFLNFERRSYDILRLENARNEEFSSVSAIINTIPE